MDWEKPFFSNSGGGGDDGRRLANSVTTVVGIKKTDGGLGRQLYNGYFPPPLRSHTCRRRTAPRPARPRCFDGRVWRGTPRSVRVYMFFPVYVFPVNCSFFFYPVLFIVRCTRRIRVNPGLFVERAGKKKNTRLHGRKSEENTSPPHGGRHSTRTARRAVQWDGLHIITVNSLILRCKLLLFILPFETVISLPPFHAQTCRRRCSVSNLALSMCLSLKRKKIQRW